MKKNRFNVYKQILTTIIMPAVMLIGTILIVYYSKGYRFYLQEDITVQKTGVLSIDSSPNRATLYVNNIIKGQTPKTLGSVPTGIYNVKIEKDNYHTWEKKLPVIAEKSTPYYVYLFKKNPQVSIDWKLPDTNQKLIKSYTSENKSHFIILTEEILDENVDTTIEEINTIDESEKLKTYRIYNYALNRGFWDINSNPELIYEEELTEEPVIQISPDGSSILIKADQNYYLATGPNDIQNLDLNEFTGEYDIHWAENNEYLILENKSSEMTEIYSYNLSNNVIVLLLKDTNNPSIYWKTYSDKNLYYLNHEKPEDSNRKYYQIIQRNIDGTKEEILLDKIYYKNDRSDLESILKKQNTLTFANSPNCQVFVGEIKSFSIQKDGLGIAIETTESLNWYNIEKEKYSLVSPYPNSEILKYSPDQKNFSYISHCNNTEIDEPKDCLKVYTFEKKDSDHITKLGSKKVLEIKSNSQQTKYKWLSNSTYISYEHEDYIKIIDIDGENKIPLISTTNKNMIKYLIDSRNENIYLLQENVDPEEYLIRITGYEIH